MRTLLASWLLVFVSGSLLAAPPNVVMIIADDQAWTDYSFMGHPHIKTPNIDKLAGESLTFKRGYVPSSLCRPSLATMITGLYPHQHKITSNDPPLPKGKTGGQANRDPEFLKLRQEMIAYIDKVPTLPKVLGEKGYLSHQSGKWWEGDHCRCFTHGMTHGDPKRGGRHGDDGLKIGRQGLTEIFDFITLAQKEKKPFYVWYAPFMPHSPHTPPARFLEKYKGKTDSLHVAKYWAMCEWFDETVGELLGHLDKQGLRENTIVVYVCDNGWIQNPNSPAYAPKSKRSQYDGGVRTPIMVRWPGKVKPALPDDLASSIDLAPTIIKACGLSPTDQMQGINLLDESARKKRDAIFGEIFEHNAVDIHKPVTSLQYRWMIEGTWKLILPAKQNVPMGVIELYDLANDPHETENLASKHPDRVERMTKRIDGWWELE